MPVIIHTTLLRKRNRAQGTKPSKSSAVA